MARKTKHAAIRLQQRGITQDQLEMILEYGESVSAVGGTNHCSIPIKNKKRIEANIKHGFYFLNQSSNMQLYKKKLQLLDKAINKKIVLSGNESEVITAYWFNT